jgi:hypothetical protein
MKKCDYNRCENSAVAHIDYYNSNLKFYCAKHYDLIVKHLAKYAQDPDEWGIQRWFTEILRRNGIR